MLVCFNLVDFINFIQEDYNLYKRNIIYYNFIDLNNFQKLIKLKKIKLYNLYHKYYVYN